MFYSSGAVGKRQMFDKGTGSKNSQTAEKMMIYEVISLVIGNINVPCQRIWKKIMVESLRPKLTTKLKRDKISAELSADCNVTRLYNGVSHAYDNSTVRPSEVDDGDDDTGGFETIENLLEEAEDDVTEGDLIMNNMQFGEENLEEDNDDDEEEEDGKGQKKYGQYCIVNIWRAGWAAITKMDVKKVRDNAEARNKRKRAMTKYVIQKVNDMKQLAGAVEVGSEMDRVDPATWTDYVHSLRPDIYRDVNVNLFNSSN